MKKITIKLSILLLPLGAFVLIINCMVDPANLLSEEIYIENIAKILAKGNNVDNITNYDERLLQKHYLEKKKNSMPDIVIMGSSRIMEIGNNIFPNKELYNIGVSHADINDLIALSGVLEEFNIKPKEVLINVDPYLILEYKEGTEWLSLLEYHQKFIKNHSELPLSKIPKINFIKKYTTLLTFDYFNSSIQYVLNGNSKSIIDIGKRIPEIHGRLSNGCVCYSYEYCHPNQSLTSSVAKGMGKKEKLTNIDNEKLKMLEFLIKYFKEKGIKCSLIMLPYHSEFYNEVNKNKDYTFIKYETYFKSFANQHKVPIRGSFSLLKCNLKNIDMYDTYHCSKNGLKMIYENPNLKFN